MAEDAPPEESGPSLEDGNSNAGVDEPTPPPALPPGPPAPPSPRWTGSTKRTMAIALAIAALAVLYLARNVLALAALAGLIAFLVSPVIRLLHERLHFPRALALLVSYLFVFFALLFTGFLIVDGVIGAVQDINVAEAEDSLKGTAQDFLGSVREIHVLGYTIDMRHAVDPMLENLRNAGTTKRSSSGSKRVALSSSQVETLFGGLTSSVSSLGSAIVAAITSAIITVLVAIYLNADSSKFRVAFLGQVPDGYEGDAQQLANRTARIWKGYLYGQMFNSLTVGLMMWLALWIVGLPGAFVFALLLALLNMVPTFGPILAAIPAVLAAVALGSVRFDMSRLGFTLLVVLLYVAIVQVHAMLMAPFITGRAVRLSPATVMLGLLVGIHVAGLVGALLVVPVVATGKEMGRYVLAKLTDHDPFAEPTEAPATDTGPGTARH